MNINDLKDYTVLPPEGLYDQIQSRVRRRRLWRRAGAVGGGAALVAAVAGVVLLTRPAAPVEATAPTARTQVAEAMHTVPAVPHAAVATPQASAPASAEAAPLPVAPAPSQQAEGRATEAAPLTMAPAAPVAEAVPTAASAAPQEVQPAVAMVEAKPDLMLGEATTEPQPATAPASPLDDGDKAGPMPDSTAVVKDIMWAPNAIAPASDDDALRHFGVRFSSPVTGFHIRIFNRKGQMVYQSDNVAFSWDATKGGTALPQGAFVWVASYRDSEGRPHQQTGTVTVVR